MLGSVCEKRLGDRHLKVDCKAREGRGGGEKCLPFNCVYVRALK
jgi:hypothetical protein